MIAINDVEIADIKSPHHGMVKSILLEDGVIKSIADQPYDDASKIINGKGLTLSVGWCDLGTYIGDPGFEQKEDIESACNTAAAGGFTQLAVLPNTFPVIQQKNGIRYLTAGNELRTVQLYPIGAISLENEGNEITEMIDLHHAGAVAFSDGLNPIWNTDIFLKCLLYLQKFDGLLMQKPEDKWLNLYGQMHEGKISTSLGLKGIPAISEYLTIARDLKLLEYAGGKVHFSGVSTLQSVDIIREAKQKGMKVTCDVAAYNLHFTDEAILDFDANYKVSPPLRSLQHVDALWEGLKDGTIDAISTAHRPHDEECKKVEFDLADFGMLGLQTFLPMLLSHQDKLSFDKIMEKVGNNPRRLLGLSVVKIQEGEIANFTIFDKKEEWVLNYDTNRSKSINSPFWGQTLTGKVKYIFSNKRMQEI